MNRIDVIEIVAYRKRCLEKSSLFHYVNSIISEGDFSLSEHVLLDFCSQFVGGEGIVMRKIGSVYFRGRSSDLLKVKVIILPLSTSYVCYHRRREVMQRHLCWLKMKIGFHCNCMC